MLRPDRVTPENSDAIRRLFDKVWVVSLPASQDRRAHIGEHLPAFGISDFEFFDATPADDDSVAEAMPGVPQYPPCFRCGGIDCGKPNCNNYMTPPQVACVLTYRRLWRTIAEGPHERMLVLEDDVLLHPWTPRVIDWLGEEVAAGRLPFAAGKTCLLRLGWELGRFHKANVPMEAQEVSRLANPCHAVTRDFARALVTRAGAITHTADVYQHEQAPRPGEAFTIYPPIASDLSWTEGRFASTIHPKGVHVDYLRAQGREAEAAAAAALVEKHIRKKTYRPILISGHPRTGTGYAAALCRQLGADVGHEKLGAAGISSWMFAVDADANPYALDRAAQTRRALAWKWLVMPVRGLEEAAPSTVRETQYAPPSHAFRREHILRETGLDLDARVSPLDQAVWSITSWSRILMKQKPDLVFRIEDQHETLRAFLIANGLAGADAASVALDTSPVNANKKYKGVRYPKPEAPPEEWRALPADTRAEIDWYCATFGYALPGNA